MSSDRYSSWLKKASERKKVYASFLRKAPLKAVLKHLPELHEEAFEKVNCLECGNCCKGYSPRFKTPDIKRISKFLGQKESVFIDKHLKIDEDGDYVLQSSPCTFLGSDNCCSIYEVRPSDCSRFPYTDEDVFVKRPAITEKNIAFCPAAYLVIEGLMTRVNP